MGRYLARFSSAKTCLSEMYDEFLAPLSSEQRIMSMRRWAPGRSGTGNFEGMNQAALRTSAMSMELVARWLTWGLPGTLKHHRQHRIAASISAAIFSRSVLLRRKVLSVAHPHEKTKCKVIEHEGMKLWSRQDHSQLAAEQLRRKHMRTKLNSFWTRCGVPPSN